MVKRMEERKLRGGYYTPHEITKFISEWAITSTKESILEPSCGDGNFIEASIQRLKKIGLDSKKIKNNILGIELIKEEADKTKNRVEALDVNPNCIINSDFFTYISKNRSKKFDVIIGNPPFIRYQNFPEVHRDLAIKMMIELGFISALLGQDITGISAFR